MEIWPLINIFSKNSKQYNINLFKLYENCTSCLGINEIKNILNKAFDKNMVEKMTFHQWVSAGQCSLETILSTPVEFIELFCEELTTLLLNFFFYE